VSNRHHVRACSENRWLGLNPANGTYELLSSSPVVQLLVKVGQQPCWAFHRRKEVQGETRVQDLTMQLIRMMEEAGREVRRVAAGVSVLSIE
jgi:hypothetical protein